MATTKRRPRAETLETAEFKKAHAKALAARKKKTCPHGHKLSDANNVHAGTLLRTGKIMCQKCWVGYAEKSRAKKSIKAAKPKKAARKPKAPKPTEPVAEKKPFEMKFPAGPVAVRKEA